MEFAAIIGIISTIANVVMKAIPFVEELLAGHPGESKSAAVMNIAKVAICGVEGAVIRNNPQWEFLEPLVQNFINDAIAAVNAIQAKEKSGG